MQKASSPAPPTTGRDVSGRTRARSRRVRIRVCARIRRRGCLRSQRLAVALLEDELGVVPEDSSVGPVLARCRALLVAGAAAAGGFDGCLRLPALKEVDAARVEQVGRDGKVEAAICPASLFDDAYAAREVGLALLRVDRDVACDDDHGCAPLPKSSCVKASAIAYVQTARVPETHQGVPLRTAGLDEGGGCKRSAIHRATARLERRVTG